MTGNQLSTLCSDCTADLQEKLETLSGPDTTGVYCPHNKACAVVISTNGEVNYSQVSGPVTEQQAVHVMAGIAAELHPSALHNAPSTLQ